MTGLSVRVSEEATRPLGHAIVTVTGLPNTLRTLEFALSRRGYAANHLGPDGWQGAEHWLQPKEAWFSGDALKFVLGPNWVYQLENMPYELALRGEGLRDIARVAFLWPLELDVEEAGSGERRQWLGGTRIDAQPRSPSSIAAAAGTAGSSSFQPPPTAADIQIPDVAIPDTSPTPGPSSVAPSLVRAMETTALRPEQPPPLPPSAHSPPPVTPDRESTGERPVTPPPLPVDSGPVPPTPPPADHEPVPTIRRASTLATEQPQAIGETPPPRRGRWAPITAIVAGLAVITALAGWWLWNSRAEWPDPTGDETAQPAVGPAPEPAAPPPAVPETPAVADTEARPAADADPSSPTPRLSEPAPHAPAAPGTASMPAAPLAPSTSTVPPENAGQPPATVPTPRPQAEPGPAPTVTVKPVSPAVIPPAPPQPSSPPITRTAPPAPAVSEPRTSDEPPSTAVNRPASAPGNTPAPEADVAGELEKSLKPKEDLEKELESQLGKSKADLQSELEQTLKQKPAP